MLRAPRGTLQALTPGPSPEYPAVVKRSGPGPALGAASRLQAARGGDRGRPRPAGITALLESVDVWFRTQPYQSAFFVASVKAAVADLLAQTCEKMPRDDEVVGGASDGTLVATCASPARGTGGFLDAVSWRRTVAFFLYGGFYQGCAQYFIFNVCYPAWFGDVQDVLTVAEEVLFDQFVLTPFLCLPIAYLIKALTFNTDLLEGMRRYFEDAGNDLLIKYWLIWGPVQCLTFGVVPPHWRIPFIASVSFFWLVVLSSISSRGDAERSSGSISRGPPASALAEA